MAFTTEENQIINILKGGDKLIFKNIELLVKDYKEKTGKKACRTCPSGIRVVILTLKNFYKMANFRFKRNAASYKNAKGDKTTISNSTMTDEKALIFLKTNPDRIKLFSEFPSNWKKLIKGEIETEEQKESRIAAEAEAIEAAKEAAKIANGESTEETIEEIVDKDNPTEEELNAVDEDGYKAEEVVEETAEQIAEREATEAAENAAAEALKPTEDDLMKMSLADLRKKYPEVKATSIRDFVDKVIAL